MSIQVFKCVIGNRISPHLSVFCIISYSQYLQNNSFLLRLLSTTSFSNQAESPNLGQLVFTSPTSTFYGFSPCTLHCMKETMAHRRIRLRNHRALKSPPSSPSKSVSPRGILSLVHLAQLYLYFEDCVLHYMHSNSSTTVYMLSNSLFGFLYSILCVQ